MRSKSVIAAVLVLLFLLAGASAALADTIHVPGDYATIQAAVDAAASGDVVSVAAGTYAEHVTIAKPLTLTGAGAGATVIDGSGSGPVLTVSGSGVTVRELTVTNGGSDAHPASNGVRVSGATGASFAGVEVSFCEAAYMLVASSATSVRNGSMHDNHAYAFDNGDTFSPDTLLEDCEVFDNLGTQGGGAINAYAGSSGFTVRRTHLHDNVNAAVQIGWSGGWLLEDSTLEGNAHGLILDSANSGTCRGNEISDNTGYGVALAGWGTMNNLFTANAIRGNDQGCRVSGPNANANTFRENTIAANAVGVAVTLNASGDNSGNAFYRNNFAGNTLQATDASLGGNAWDNGLPDGGNWWSDWTAPDADHDGFVDAAYVFAGGQDGLPFADRLPDVTVPGDYATIQAAVDAAASGDVVSVAAGTYAEHVTIAKPLTLTGAGAGATVIDGSGSGPVLTVSGSGVTVRELTVTNGGSDAHPASNGVRVSGATGASFAGVEVSFCEAAYMLVASSATSVRNGSMHDNHAYAFDNGDTFSPDTLLEDCEVFDNLGTQGGGAINAYAGSSGFTVRRTHLHDNVNAAVQIGWSGGWLLEDSTLEGNAHGLILDSANSGTCRGNEISDNTGYGVALAGWGTMNNLFTANAIRGNDQGCRVSGPNANANTFRENTIAANAVGVAVTLNASGDNSGNAFYRNNFAGNTLQATDASLGGNAWDNGLPDGGNWWSDWTAPDADHDGFVDAAYVFTGGQDDYPFADEVRSRAFEVHRTVENGGTFTSVYFKGWTIGVTLALTVDDQATPESPDYETNVVAEAPQEGGDGFGIGVAYEVKPGDVVTVTDGSLTKSHTVTDIAVTEIDTVADVLRGTAAPGSELTVYCPTTSRWTSAVGDGTWMVDFSVSNDPDQAIYDILPGSTGGAEQFDADGDSTVYDWAVPDPFFSVSPVEPAEHMWGEEWATDSEVLIEIDDPDTTEPVDFSMTTGTDGNGRFELFDIPFDIRASHIVTVSQGATVKTHVVIDLTVTQMDPVADTVSGIGKPDTETVVNMWDDPAGEGSQRIVTSDGSGAWTADFSVPGADGSPVFDIRPGMMTYTYQADEDRDQTQIDHALPLRSFEVWRGTWDGVFFKDWTAGETLVLTIDDPTTPESPDYETSVVAEEPEEGSDGFGLGIDYQVRPGDVVKVADGATTKSHTVTDVAVTSVDAAADVVHGTAAPGTELWVSAPGNYRWTSAAGGGTWMTDFSVSDDPEQPVLDIVPGTSGTADQEDADGDSTVVSWDVPRPEGWQHDPATGHYYLFVENDRPWADAEAYAVSLGGHLVTVNDAAENDWLIATFGAEYYIGMNDRAAEGTWVWASGEPVTFSGWFDGEPNDSMGEDVAVIENRPPIGWNDVPDSGSQFVVELATLADTGHIAGTVTNESSAGLSNMKVSVYASDYDRHMGWPAGWALTGADGSYDVVGLAEGSYLVEFTDDAGYYATQYFDGDPSPWSVDEVVVTLGETTSGIDAVLTVAGHITGTVTDASFAGLRVYVGAFRANGLGDWEYVNGLVSNPDGSFDIGHLSAGTYTVEFARWYSAGVYAIQYFDGVSSPSLASEVIVVAGETTSGVDAVLALAGRITGRVTDADGVGLGGIRVRAHRADGTGEDWPMAEDDAVLTDADGNYEIAAGLPEGDYRVEFRDDSGTYATQYYDNQPTLDAATPISVTAGLTTPDIDAVLWLVPAVTSFDPISGVVGTSVTVSGSGLSGATAVTFNGTAATSFSVVSDTQVTASVPAGATTGKVAVTTPGGTSTSAASFTVISPTATVTAPSGSFAQGTITPVTWTTPSAVTSGEFGVWIRSSTGSWYVGAIVAANGTASYARNVNLSMIPGSGYYATVYWRPTPTSGWINGAVGPAFTITAAGPTATVTAPSGSFAQGTITPVNWTTATPLASGEFGVWVRSSTGAWYIGAVVPANGTSSYSRTVNLSMAQGTGYYATVYWRPTPTSAWTGGAVGPAFAITAPSPTPTVTAPTGSFVQGTLTPVTWTTPTAVASGEFGVWVRNSAGAWYIGAVVPANGTSSYSRTVNLSMAPGAGYYATVYYRPTPTSAWINGAVGPGFTITGAGPTITVTAPTGAIVQGTLTPVTWTTPAAVTSGEFGVWVRNSAGAWYIGAVVPADGTSSYSRTVNLSMAPGSGYYATVYYRATPSSGWINSAIGPAFTIL